jgi:hypothetical protein
MIDCREAVSRMWAYLSHGLESKGVDELEEHLGECQRCCGELEFSRELRARIADVGAEHVPPHVRRRIDEVLGVDGPPPGAGS